MTRHLHRVALKFPRHHGEAFNTPEWANPIERPAPRSPLARWVGWSLAAFVAFYLMVRG